MREQCVFAQFFLEQHDFYMYSYNQCKKCAANGYGAVWGARINVGVSTFSARNLYVTNAI